MREKNNFKDFRFDTWVGVVTICFKNCRHTLKKDETRSSCWHLFIANQINCSCIDQFKINAIKVNIFEMCQNQTRYSKQKVHNYFILQTIIWVLYSYNYRSHFINECIARNTIRIRTLPKDWQEQATRKENNPWHTHTNTNSLSL